MFTSYEHLCGEGRGRSVTNKEQNKEKRLILLHIYRWLYELLSVCYYIVIYLSTLGKVYSVDLMNWRSIKLILTAFTGIVQVVN